MGQEPGQGTTIARRGEKGPSVPPLWRPTLRWDAPLLSTLARELDERFRGARLKAVAPEFEARRLALHFQEATLLVRLHPREAGVFVLDPVEPPAHARRLAARLRGVTTPPDERIMVLSFLRLRGAPAEVDLVLEWITNRHNAALTEGPDRVVRLLFQTREGDRPLRQGHPYQLPPPSSREGASAPISYERWQEMIAPAGEGVANSDRKRALVSTFAWTSAINAPALLASDPLAAYTLWSGLARIGRGEASAEAVIIDTPRGLQPYVLPLPGWAHTPAPSILAALDQVSRDAEDTEAPTLISAALVRRLEHRVESLRTRCARLEEELASLDDPAQIQGWGDLLLARFGEVPRASARVRLMDFDGHPVDIDLDPALTPDGNARRYYDEAARIRRARERLPALAATARQGWTDAQALLERARSGDAAAAEVEAALPEGTHGPGDSDDAPLPYRRYRSSGGLEVRVGRGSRKNDELTFRHSAPNDIWLHARDVAGAHVILRWDREGNPPARDLTEAAVLAALGSKARTSGSVPVDWTRRKHVRKPRKSPPGLVVPDRVKTLFVEPDPELAARLRDWDER